MILYVSILLNLFMIEFQVYEFICPINPLTLYRH